MRNSNLQVPVLHMYVCAEMLNDPAPPVRSQSYIQEVKASQSGPSRTKKTPQCVSPEFSLLTTPCTSSRLHMFTHRVQSIEVRF
jgi:hypothetical protein